MDLEAKNMEEKYKHKIITIPNVLSFFRLLLIPVIVWLYIVKKYPIWTMAVLALSGITDIVDGIIARKCNMISDFGKAFDPVADKLTQIAMLFCLVSRFRWMLLEKLFHCRISLPVYIFALTYAIGPMLGHCWKLYYTIPVWDKLLHISGGVMFAILGAYFFDLLAKNKELPVVRTIFALCFSMAIAVLWEFCEFGADTFGVWICRMIPSFTV